MTDQPQPEQWRPLEVGEIPHDDDKWSSVALCWVTRRPKPAPAAKTEPAQATSEAGAGQGVGEFLPVREYDWPEDFPHENGNYWNNCEYCWCRFRGHKRRLYCKSCANYVDLNELEAEGDDEPKPQQSETDALRWQGRAAGFKAQRDEAIARADRAEARVRELEAELAALRAQPAWGPEVERPDGAGLWWVYLADGTPPRWAIELVSTMHALRSPKGRYRRALPPPMPKEEGQS